jgi:uncharacterized protein YgfB (UPF0149 family)
MTFDELTRLLEVEGFEETAAELHGVLCGRLAGGERLAGDGLREALVQSLESDEELIDNALAELARLYQLSLAALSDSNFAFSPLLPDDDRPLGERVEALSQWAQGFLDGLVDAGLSGDSLLSEDASHALGDIVAIAHAAYDGEGDNEDETDFSELEEYIRIAAILIFAELASPEDVASPGSITLH